MDLKRVGRNFYKVYRKEDGSFFKGLIGKSPLTGRYTNYAIGGTILYTSPTANVKVGDIFFTNFNRAVMCMDDMPEESLGSTQKLFTLKIVETKMNWLRAKFIEDPVSGELSDSGEYEDLGNLYCAFEDDGKSMDTMQIKFDKYNVVTNKELQVNDILVNDKDERFVVMRSEHYVGATVANVQRQ